MKAQSYYLRPPVPLNARENRTTTSPNRQSEAPTSGWKVLAEVVASVGGATAALSALFLFFGYVRTSTYYEYYGVPLGVLGLSPTDYLLDSPDSLFKPMVGATVAALVICIVIWLLRAVRLSAIQEQGGVQGESSSTAAAAASKELPCLLRLKRKAWSWGSADWVIRNALILVAVAAVCVGVQGLRQKAPAERAALALALAGVIVIALYFRERADESRREWRLTGFAMISMFLLFGAAFWSATIYARHLGADEAASNFGALPEATIYAKNEVMMRGAVEDRPQPGAQWKYNFPNYRLLAYLNGRWIVTHKVLDPDSADHHQKLETYVLPRDDANYVIEITNPNFH